MSAFDPRLHAFRPDLADVGLRGKLDAPRFAQARLCEVIAPVVNVHCQPQADARQLTQALMGERVRVFEAHEGWAWGQLEADRYVGYLPLDALADRLSTPTHRVHVPSTFLFPGPDPKSQPVVMVTMNAKLAVAAIEGNYARLADGRFVSARHLKPIAEREADFVTVAEMLRWTPYLWGGKSVLGLDCSGLVQLALEAAGRPAPRDSDMQDEALGRALDIGDLEALRRGDLVFWDGHVGIMVDGRNMLHANGHHMLVELEPLRQAAARIAATCGAITSIKRLWPSVQ